MSNYSFNSTVSSQEAAALKEMIFKRARERAQALADDVQSTYTSSMQNDVMDLARDSFVSNKNPFSQVIEKTEEVQKEEEPKNSAEICFARRNVDEIKAQIQYRNQVNNSDLAMAQVNSTMLEGRDEFVKKAGFMGALNFLNAQATISLVKNKGQSFEALA